MAGLALRFNTAFLAMAMTYSRLDSASRKSSSSGCAKPPSRRTRIRAPGKAVGDHIDQTTQDPLGSDCGGHIAGTQHGDAQILFSFIIEAYKSHDWQVAPAVVVPVEKR